MSNESFEFVARPGSTTSITPRTPSGTIATRGSRRTGVAESTATTQVPSSAVPSTSGETQQQRSLEELDGIVERFRSNEISKPKALALIVRAAGFDPDSSSVAQEQTLELYLAAINSHEASTVESLERGQSRSGVTGNGGEVAEPVPEPQRDVDVDRRIDDLIDELSNSGSVRPDAGDDDVDFQPFKRRKLALSDMPWYAAERDGRDSTNPICRKNRELLAMFALDIPQVKFWIKNSARAPSGFPTSQWERIIRGEPVDLNAVFSNLHRTEPAKENVGRLGDTQISFAVAEPKKKVETAGDWISAWNRTVQATRFIFKHREEELREYGEYIESLFAAKVTSSHPRIIMYDVAIRNEVAGGQRAVLTDTLRFQNLRSAIVEADGIEVTRHQGSRDQSRRGSPGKPSVCHRFNSAAGCSSSDCKFKHVCRICQATDHGKEGHKDKGKQ